MAEARRISFTEFEEELKALAQNHEAALPVNYLKPYPFVRQQIISDISETQNTIIENFKGNQFFEGFGIIDPRKMQEWLKSVS
jgi:hypothetical protein